MCVWKNLSKSPWPRFRGPFEFYPTAPVAYLGVVVSTNYLRYLSFCSMLLIPSSLYLSVITSQPHFGDKGLNMSRPHTLPIPRHFYPTRAHRNLAWRSP